MSPPNKHEHQHDEPYPDVPCEACADEAEARKSSAAGHAQPGIYIAVGRCAPFDQCAICLAFVQRMRSNGSVKQDGERQFPIQPSYSDDDKKSGSSIPWWLAEEAYAQYAHHYGREQSIDRLAERGGFGRTELLDLLAGGDGSGAALRSVRTKRSSE